jgi:hypothetical protein
MTIPKGKKHIRLCFIIKKDDQQKWYKNIDLVFFRSFKLNSFYRFFKKSSFAQKRNNHFFDIF